MARLFTLGNILDGAIRGLSDLHTPSYAEEPSRFRLGAGMRLPLRDDHVPPKNLFGKPRPSTLVTVPSCLECNRGASGDDEYFRTMVALRQDVNDTDARFARAAVIRSLARPQARGLSDEHSSHDARA
jgi:hypothetical protein